MENPETRPDASTDTVPEQTVPTVEETPDPAPSTPPGPGTPTDPDKLDPDVEVQPLDAGTPNPYAEGAVAQEDYS